MPAIITNKFRINAAEQFKEDFAEADATNSYYLFFAKSTPWADVEIQLRDATSGLSLNYVVDETVWLDTAAPGSRTFATAEATGKVKYWNSIDKILYLTDVTGTNFVCDGSNGVIFNNLTDLPLDGNSSGPATCGGYIDTTGTTVYDDNTSAPSAIDSEFNSYSIWNNMLGMKEIRPTDVAHIIPRVNWATGNIYNQYSDTIDLEDYPTDSSAEYVDSIYIMNEDYSVYKCISNNKGSASTYQPTSTSVDYITLADGYVWKYMYTISAADVAKFVTDDWIPVRNTTSNPGTGQPYEGQWNVYNDATNGELYIRILDGGTGYESGDWSSNTDLHISGRGYNVEANTEPRAITITDGVISAITIDPVGNNYEYAIADLDFTSASGGYPPSRPAIIEVLIGPPGGHGSNAITELGSKYIMISSKLSGSEGSILSVENDYRILGIIHNPKEGGSIANDTVYDLTTKLIFNSGNGPVTFTEDENIKVSTSAPGTYDRNQTHAKIVEFSPHATAASCRVTNIICNETVDSTNGFKISNDVYDDTNSYYLTIDRIEKPTIDYGVGDIIYVEQRRPISRASEQIEDIKLILEF